MVCHRESFQTIDRMGFPLLCDGKLARLWLSAITVSRPQLRGRLKCESGLVQKPARCFVFKHSLTRLLKGKNELGMRSVLFINANLESLKVHVATKIKKGRKQSITVNFKSPSLVEMSLLNVINSGKKRKKKPNSNKHYSW